MTTTSWRWGRRHVSYIPSCCEKIAARLCPVVAQKALFLGEKDGVGNGSSCGLPLKIPEALSWCA